MPEPEIRTAGPMAPRTVGTRLRSGVVTPDTRCIHHGGSVSARYKVHNCAGTATIPVLIGVGKPLSSYYVDNDAAWRPVFIPSLGNPKVFVTP